MAHLFPIGETVDPQWDDEEGTVEYVTTIVEGCGVITPGDFYDSWIEDRLVSLKFPDWRDETTAY